MVRRWRYFVGKLDSVEDKKKGLVGKSSLILAQCSFDNQTQPYLTRSE